METNNNYFDSWKSTEGLCKHSLAMGKNEGVYAIFQYDFLTNKSTVLYIGRSLNLSDRWKSHNVYNSILNDDIIPSVKWILCNNSAQLEQQLIKEFTPKYNKQFK